MTAAEIRNDVKAAKGYQSLDWNQFKTLVLKYAWNIVDGDYSVGSIPAELQEGAPFHHLDRKQERMVLLWLASENARIFDAVLSLTLTDGTNLTLTDGTDLRLTS